jgi:hypothetical protein
MEVKIIDAREIVEPFQPVIDLYEVSSDSSTLLYKLIQEEWTIFDLNPETTISLIKEIFADVKSVNPDLFNQPVINKTRNHYLTEGIIQQWEALKSEIIHKNRFFLENVIELESLEKYLCDLSKKYDSGEIFYRGRISKKEGLPISELGKPPWNKSTAGRANPQGIPYLYLSNTIETTLYETRAIFLDYVTVGKFVLNRPIKVVKLRTVQISSPFEENIFDKLLYRPFLKGLEEELSRPLRRFDSELDYLPTQYLCEFIKHIGFDGVEYGSSMKKNGINLAIFDDATFECVEREVIEIKNIDISFQ